MKRLKTPAIVAVIAVAISVPITRATRNGQDTERRVNDNEKTLTYICSTTYVLDQLVVVAAAQIDANFKNGTYGKLVAQGLLSRENVEAARATRSKYLAAHRTLKANGACISSERSGG